MATSLKINELPSAVDLNITDLFLVSDVEAERPKTVTLESLNQNLNFEDLEGYDIFTDAIDNINDTISTIVGDVNLADEYHSLIDLKIHIDSIKSTIDVDHFEVSRRVDVLEDRMTQQLMSNASNLASLQTVIAAMEERNFQSGLATGYLYAQNVQVGED